MAAFRSVGTEVPMAATRAAIGKGGDAGCPTAGSAVAARCGAVARGDPAADHSVVLDLLALGDGEHVGGQRRDAFAPGAAEPVHAVDEQWGGVAPGRQRGGEDWPGQ